VGPARPRLKLNRNHLSSRYLVKMVQAASEGGQLFRWRAE
jgi:hypothetical protein